MFSAGPRVSGVSENLKGRIILMYVQRLGTGNLFQMTEPLGLKILAAFVEERGYEALVFAGSVNEGAAVVQAELDGRGIDVIGLYCDYENRSAVESFCSLAKAKWNLVVLVGGPQVVALGKEFLSASGCDALVRGEGEYPLFRLLEYYLRGRGSMEAIPGVSHLDGQGRMVRIPPGPPLQNLDDLPVGKLSEERTAHRSRKNFAVLTGRGCPFRCAFCFEGSVPGKVRLRSVSHVMKEIHQALRHNPGIQFLWFADDTFTLDPRRVEAFSRELAALRKDHDFVWFCECHPSTLIKWPEMLPVMIEAGLVRMQIGMESGASAVLKLYRKQTSIHEIEQVVALCMQSGLSQLVGNIIIGGAAETRSTFEETLRFTSRLLRIGPGMLDFTSTFFLPLPETAITRNPSDYGIRILDMDSLTSMGDVAVVETNSLKREEITAMRFEFTQHVCEEMAKLYREGEVPEDRIRTQFALKAGYGIESIWYKAVFSGLQELKARYGIPACIRTQPGPPHRLRYNTLMKRADARVSGGIPPLELEAWRPQRTLDLWSNLNFSRGFPRVGGYVLSPLEYQILLHSAGKLTLRNLFETLFQQFRGPFEEDYDAFRRTASAVLKRFEDNLWLVYVQI